MRIQFKLFLTIIYVVLCHFSLWSQNAANLNIAQTTKAIYAGTTKPINELIKVAPMSKEKKEQWKKDFKQPKNFIGRGTSKVIKPELEHQGKDKLRQGIIYNPASITEATLLVNINGNTSGPPNDPSGDIGKDHYVQLINATLIGVYDKLGNEISSFSANTLWSALGFSSAGDPIVLYDQEFDKWIITEFEDANRLLIAISETSDPMGSYDVYSFQTPFFPDYPKYAIWSDAITVTTNEEGPGTLHVYAINKSELYSAKDEVQIQRVALPGNENTEAGFFVATPVDWTGQNKPTDKRPLFLALDDSSWGNVSEDQINIFALEINWADPSKTSFDKTSIITSPFDGNPCSVSGFGFSCVPQKGNGGGLDGIPEVIMNQAVYRNFLTHESMVFNFITDVTDGDNLSGIRWVELRKTSGNWELFQEGTFSPNDGLDRYMAGICIDGAGNIGLAYNVSSLDEFVGIRYTGRKWNDELGLMTVPEQLIIDGSNTISSGARFGDYAQMGIDPINDRTFWFTTEFAGAPGNSTATRIVAFELDKDNTDIGIGKLQIDKQGGFLSEQDVIVRINNYGKTPVSNFLAGYKLADNGFVTELVNQTINPGENINFTFSQKINLVGAGEYELLTFTSLQNDERVVNDSLYSRLNKIGAFDAAIADVQLDNPISCDSILEGNIKITNFGGEELTSANIKMFFEGGIVFETDWNGNLKFCQSELIPFSISDLPSGEGLLTIEISDPNGEVDQNSTNNQGEVMYEILQDGIYVTLTILTDDYPEETTWEIIDANNQIIYSGGPYNVENSEQVNTICLQDELCYSFIIYDSYGDGIFEPSYYEITNSWGNILANLQDNFFGFEEVNNFCASSACVILAAISTLPADTNGGTISIDVLSGLGPFMYSIDGGLSFQNSSLFENVPAGIYQIVVKGDEDCLYEDSVIVEACALQVLVEYENYSDVPGSISILVQEGNGPYQYSIDGGITFQNNPLFNNLEIGIYEILVVDSNGCSFTTMIEIKKETSTKSEIDGIVFLASPNPTNGFVQLTLKGNVQAGTFLTYKIYDSSGQSIREATLVKYDDAYISPVSLFYQPAGVYYIKIFDQNINKMVKIIKL